MTLSEAATAESPTPARGGIPVLSDLLRVVKAMFAPGDAFAEAAPKAPFWGAWLAVTLIFMVTQYLMSPFQMRAQELVLQEQGRQIPEAMRSMGMIIGLAVTPLITLMIAAIAALVLWVTVSLMGGEGRFKQLLSVNIHSWGPFLIQQFVMFTVLKMRGLGSMTDPRDMQVALGADLLLPAETEGFVRAVAAGVNPFSIWGLVITAVGLQVMLKLEKGRAWTVAIVAWIVSLMVGGLLAGLFQR